MHWSFRIARILGIGLYVHWSFLALLAWIAADLLMRGAAPRWVAYEVGFVLAVFGCIVLHEFGHALAARRYGIRTIDITLLPIGGLARMERLPRQPLQEVVVALAGPAVNVVIAAVLIGVLAVAGRPIVISWMSLAYGPFLTRLTLINLALVAFNLLPAFPMDGGRVLRALLASRLSYTRSTWIAAWMGRGMAAVFATVGLLTGQWVLLLIATFIFVAAGREAELVRRQEMLDSQAAQQCDPTSGD